MLSNLRTSNPSLFARRRRRLTSMAEESTTWFVIPCPCTNRCSQKLSNSGPLKEPADKHSIYAIEIGVVQQVCGVLEQVDFARSLDPAHARHHRRTINQGGVRQQGVEFFPACSAHVRFFDP